MSMHADRDRSKSRRTCPEDWHPVSQCLTIPAATKNRAETDAVRCPGCGQKSCLNPRIECDGDA